MSDKNNFEYTLQSLNLNFHLWNASNSISKWEKKTQGNEQKNRDIFKKQALKLYKNTERKNNKAKPKVIA